MPRVRVGVVLLIPPPLECEINGLRRAVGDGTYGRVPAHLTLVPPVNVNEEDYGRALAVLREAASATRPFAVHLGSPATFLPANPVLYLPLAGEGRAAVFGLRERIFKDPFERPLTWPFVPHVTIADEAQPDRIQAAEVALCDYSAEVTFDRVHLLQEGPGRVWGPVADAPFAPAAVIGRGGLPLELTISERLDPEAKAFSNREWAAWHRAEGFDGDPGQLNVAIVGRRDGAVVAVAEGRASGDLAYLANLIVDPSLRGEGIGSHLLAAFVSTAAERGCSRLVTFTWAGTPAEGFYRRHGWVEDHRRAQWWRDRDLLHLRREL